MRKLKIGLLVLFLFVLVYVGVLYYLATAAFTPAKMRTFYANIGAASQMASRCNAPLLERKQVTDVYEAAVNLYVRLGHASREQMEQWYAEGAQEPLPDLTPEQCAESRARLTKSYRQSMLTLQHMAELNAAPNQKP